ncbi:hypothetical protein [Deinococcus hopiensis]|uniref:hypothetical protein n=1 Tax=Deinococcus hopiensis TaxID=309885 RepID=UPI00111BDB2A|nr:hypothetical protein [Deinococcus hopiensis]
MNSSLHSRPVVAERLPNGPSGARSLALLREAGVHARQNFLRTPPAEHPHFASRRDTSFRRHQNSG